MKTLKIFTLALLALVITSCSEGTSSEKAIANADVDLAIEGMVCSVGCAKTIEKKMTEMAGIVSIDVDFENKSAHIVYDNRVLSGEAIEESIEEMNDGQYEVEVVKENEANDSEPIEGQGGAEDEISVSERSFSFPQLITYFMKNL